METISIKNFTPEMILRKQAFRRLLPGVLLDAGQSLKPHGNAFSTADYRTDPMTYELFSQADFLREFDVNSHKINSIKYYPNFLLEGSERKITQKVRSRVSIAFQQRIFTKRLTALIGNNVNLRIIRGAQNTRGEQNMLAQFRAGWEENDMEVAIHEALTSDGKTGDCAINFFISNGKQGWRSFSYENGDILYPHYDPMTGELAVFGRRYTQDSGENGAMEEYLDVWDNTLYIRYKQTSKDSGWMVDCQPTPHGFTECPIAYHRYGNPYWSPSQDLIDGYEMALSQFCENNSAYALRILYTLGQTMEVKASVDGTPMRIDSSDTAAKIGFLEPADASASFKAQLDIMEKNIMRSSFAVETPEISSGSDMSSLTVKMLFADTYLKALEDSQNYQKFLGRCVRLFKYAYGIERGKITEFTQFKVKAELTPFIFMSESETINSIVQLVGTGVLSKQTATEIAYESGYGTADEWDRIINETHDEYAGIQQTQNTQDLNTIANARNNNQ